MPVSPSAHTRSTEAFFRAKAASWSRNYDKDGEMAARLALFSDSLAARLPPGGTVLDFGCGSGDIALHLAHCGWRVTGCDVTAEMVDAARVADADRRVEWVRIDPSAALPFAPAQFDAILASSVLEYVDDPAAAIRSLAALLRPGGVFLASVPDERHPIRRRERWRRLALRLPGIVPIMRRTRWAEGTDYLIVSRNRFSIARWTGLFAEAGLCVSPVGACDGALVLLQAAKA